MKEYTDKEKEIIDTLSQVPYELLKGFPINPRTNTIYIIDRGNYKYENGEIIQIFEEYIWQDKWILIDRIEHKDEVQE